MTRHANIIVAAIVTTLAILPLAPGVCDAKKISDYKQIVEMEYVHIHGAITAKSPAGDYLLMRDTKVFLIESTFGRKTLATSIYGKDGEKITFSDLKVGDWLYVYAGGMNSDGYFNVAAKEIYVVPKKMTESEKKSFNQKISSRPWK
ncbi:MAG TPA: hypothetical protein PKM41_01450 [Deltaproteobacteria bacterium]|nr:hypothetical protein [Deltaproteobacteria bacterium]HOI07024.1 hypothetical protein [Deltaproteobacteria bacterium]